jgi:hypothetical protein
MVAGCVIDPGNIWYLMSNWWKWRLVESIVLCAVIGVDIATWGGGSVDDWAGNGCVCNGGGV